MAFPTIPTTGAGRILGTTQNNTTSTRTFPSLSSLTKNSGDLLIAICVVYDGNSTNAEFSSWGGGFTEFADQATTATMGIGCAYKWSTGSETGTFTVASTASQTGHAAMILMSIPGAHASTPPEAGAIVNNTSAAADPASFGPGAWGAADTLWIAVGASGETGTGGTYDGISSAPTNFTSYFDTGMSADAIGAVEAAVAFRQQNAATQDVGGFTLDLSNARNSALVIAVRPAPATVTASAAIAATADVSAAAWRLSPVNVPTPEAWVDASRISGADGDPIGTATDQSNGGNSFTQASGTLQPTKQTNEINGLPVLRFDGSDDFLQGTTALRNTDATRTVFVVARIVTPTANRTIWGWSANAKLAMTGAGVARWQLDSAGAVQNIGTMGSTAHVITIRFNSASSLDAYLDDGAATNFDPDDLYSSGTAANFGVGAQGAGTNSANVDIAELLVFDSALSDADRATVRDYLLDKWIPPTAPEHERSASIDATADISSAGTFWSVFSRSASVDAAGSIEASPQRALQRSAAISATGAIDSDGHGILSRAASLDAAGAIASSGVFWTAFERAAGLDASASIEAAAVFWTTFSRSAALDGTAMIAAAGARVTARSASLDASASLASAGLHIAPRSASLTVTASIESAGIAFSVLERSASLSAVGGIEAAGTFETPAQSHERSASLSATGAIATSATFFSFVERSASLDASAQITASPQRALQRAASVDAAGEISAAPQRTLFRAASVDASASIESRPEVAGVVQRSASIDAVASVATAHQRELKRAASVVASAGVAASAFSIRERSAQVSASADITAHPQRALQRSVSLTSTASIASSGRMVLIRSALVSASGQIAVSGDISGAIQRSAAIAATAGIATGRQVEFQRSALLSASGVIATAYRRELQRSAALTAVGAVISSGSVGAVITAAAELAASGQIAAAGRILEDFERSALIGAIAGISASGGSESGRWLPDTDDPWGSGSDGDWPPDTDQPWPEDTDDRWLVSAESNW